jgi:hypothetical protein
MKLWIVILIYAILVIFTIEADAKDLSYEQVKIIRNVAVKYNINYKQLIRIAYVESKFNAKAIRHNKNYTMDYGLFQINSIHWSTTCKQHNVFTFEGNTECAAIILSMHKQHKASDSNWIGRYHSKTYKRKVLYTKLLNRVPAWVASK